MSEPGFTRLKDWQDLGWQSGRLRYISAQLAKLCAISI
jgi:hypothetical protein